MGLFLAGLVAGLAALLGVVILEGGSLGALFGPSALILAILGPLGATMMGSDARDMKVFTKALVIALKGQAPDADEAITTFGRLADKARKEGTLALEAELPSISDPFMRAGLQMVVDGVDGDQVRAVLEAEMASATERHHASSRSFHAMAGFAPIFGLMGTILGIIGVMGHLSDPSELGHGIALALLGVLYGVVFGNLIYLPIANKLDRLHELEMHVRELVLEGVLAVREGVSARLLIERLEARMSPSERRGPAGRMASGGSTAQEAA